MHVAPHVARLTPQLLSVEAWGGATYDVALRFLAEDPWDRLAALREAMPNLPLQMLLRGRNTVGYTPYPTEVTDAFVSEAASTGIDIFRIFDALNDVGQMRPAIDAVRATGTAVAEVALCYTGDLTSPGEKLYTLDYYLRLAEQIAEAGAHVIAIKDMAGLLRAPAARTLVTALRERFDQPVHLHTHDTAGGQLATLLAAIDAGVDAVDVASAAMAGTTSQPPMSAWSPRPTAPRAPPGSTSPPSTTSSPTGRRCASSTSRSSPGCPPPPVASTATRSPAASCRTCGSRPSPSASATTSRRSRTCMPRPTGILGNIVKVTPSSKVVGDLALALVGAKADPADFEADPTQYDIPDSVIGFLSRRAGRPAGRLARALPHQGARGPHAQAARDRAAATTTGRPCRPTRGARSTACSSPGRRPSSRSRATPTPTWPSSAPASSCTASRPGSSTRSTSSPASACCSGCSRCPTPTTAACAP